MGSFSDPLIDCRQCKTRHRADNIIEDYNRENNISMVVDPSNHEAMVSYIREHRIPCPNCGGHDFTDIRKFNLMFKTYQGVTEDSKNEVYLGLRQPRASQTSGMF